MKFLSLKITNFLTMGDALPVLLDGKGLVLIQGINEDDTSATSNGVGKSSIPDALTWAIYGITARGVTGDSVVNKTAKKNCHVSVLMQDGETVYQIDRYRKHTEHKNQTFVKAWTVGSMVSVDMGKGTEKETQEVINGIMGCSLDVFMAAIYAGQEAMPDLPKMTDKQLKLLIEEAAGVERLEGAYAKAREKFNGANAQLDKHISDRTNMQLSLISTRVKVESTKMTSADFEETRAGRHEGYMGNAATIKADLVAGITEVRAMNEPALALESAELDKQLSDHDMLVKRERELAKVTSTAEGSVRVLTSEADRRKNELARIKTALDNAPEEMKKACPECGKPHTADELVEFTVHLKKKLTEKITETKQALADVETASGELKTHQKALAAYRATLPDLSTVAARSRVVSDLLADIGKRKNKLALLKKDFDRQQELAASALTEANPHAATLDYLSGEETRMVSDMELIDVKITAAQENVSLYTNVVKVFGPAGVRAHILDTVTPFLNERTADYLSALSDGNITAVWSTLSTTAKGDLKEKFNIEVENDKGAESFAGLSGGEKRKVRLATMLALQDLVASRASKPIALWIGDEIDDALDPAGLERLMGVLERKARERGTVLVVSHAELRDWIDNVVTVTKKGGYSTIEGALCESVT